MTLITRSGFALAFYFLLAPVGGTIAMSSLLAQDDSFGEQAVRLIPPPLPAGSDVTRIFSPWGITFRSGSGTAPVAGVRRLFYWFEGPQLDQQGILNGAPGEDAGPMIIDFSSPVRRISLTVASPEAVTARVKRFDAVGVALGEQTEGLWENHIVGPRVLVQDEAGRAISRIEVEYENPNVPEALFHILADFVDPPVFRRCVAQVAHGRLPEGERALQTQLSITSPAINYRDLADVIAKVSLEFRDPSGGIMPVILDGQQNSHFDYTLKDVESKIARTTGSVSGLDRGYACVVSNYPVELAAVYRILDSGGKPISETGIQGAVPGYRFFGILQKSQAEETNTALALVNVSDKEARVAVTFFLPVFKRHTVEIVLPPGEQRASFIDELVSELVEQDVEGTVEIVSDQLVVGTIVRTIRGVVSASLPLGRSRTPGVM